VEFWGCESYCSQAKHALVALIPTLDYLILEGPLEAIEILSSSQQLGIEWLEFKFGHD
jgi:hypothetical protein